MKINKTALSIVDWYSGLNAAWTIHEQNCMLWYHDVHTWCPSLKYISQPSESFDVAWSIVVALFITALSCSCTTFNAKIVLTVEANLQVAPVN